MRCRGSTRSARVRRILRRFVCVASAVVAVFVVAGVTPAAAQSFFEALFGLGQSRPQPAPPSRLGGGVVVVPPTVAGRRDEFDPLRSRRVRDLDIDEARNDNGTYQTMCVRTCDGYFWPARFPVSRRDFKQDESMCQSACGSQTRLYFRPGPGTEAEEMKDLDGKSYGASDTAFAYRKGLVNGCACRPMAWSDGERARHEGYALAEQEKALRIAQVEAGRAAAIAEAEAAKARPKPAAAEIASAAPAAVEDHDGPKAGPAETRVMAALNEPDGDVAEALVPGVARKARSKRVIEADAERARVTKSVRGAREDRPARVRAMASKPSTLAWLSGGGGKFTYPGDRPGR